MVITRLTLRRFKKFREMVLDLKPGLNLIQGPNESGKTTLRTALLAAFYGNPTSVSESTNRWATWGQTERCDLRLTYLDPQGRTCELRKDFEEQKVFWSCGEELLKTYRSIQQQIVEELGVPSETLYLVCASLDAYSLSRLENRKEIGQVLASLMTGTGTEGNARQAIQRLEDAVRELTKGMNAAAKTKGPLKKIKDDLILWLREKTELETALSDRERILIEYAEGQELSARQKQDMLDLEGVLQANRELVQARQREQELTLQHQQFEERQQDRDRKQGELERARQAVEADPVGRLTLEEYRSLQDVLKQKEQIPAEVQPAGLRSDWWIPAILGLGCGILGFLLMNLSPGFGWALVAAGAVTTIYAAVRGRQVIRQSRVLDQQNSQRKAKLSQLDEQLGQILKPIQPVTIETLVDQWPRSQSMRETLRWMEQQWVLLPPVPVEIWKAVRRDLKLHQDTLTDPGRIAKALPPLEMQRREREYVSLKEAHRQLENDKLPKLKARLDLQLADTDRLAEKEEKLEAARDKIQYLERRERVLRRALQWLLQAEQESLHPAREVLEERAGELFRRFSRGKYQALRVDEDDLSGKVLVPETQSWEDPGVLSQGAFDQFYLSLRLALSEIITQGKRPPLLLDDPFLAFDHERRQAAWEALVELAHERQVLYFSCQPELDAPVDHRVQLPVS